MVRHPCILRWICWFVRVAQQRKLQPRTNGWPVGFREYSRRLWILPSNHAATLELDPLKTYHTHEINILQSTCCCLHRLPILILHVHNLMSQIWDYEWVRNSTRLQPPLCHSHKPITITCTTKLEVESFNALSIRTWYTATPAYTHTRSHSCIHIIDNFNDMKLISSAAVVHYCPHHWILPRRCNPVAPASSTRLTPTVHRMCSAAVSSTNTAAWATSDNTGSHARSTKSCKATSTMMPIRHST